MEPWVSTLVSGSVASVVTLVGILFLRSSQQRAAATQEKQAEDAGTFGLTDRWQAWAEEQSRARVETEAKVARLDGEVREARNELDRLHLQFRRLEGRLVAAIDYIRRLLAWAGAVTHPEPHPSIPDDIADLINTRDKS